MDGHDLTRLRAIATPEMVGDFSEQLAEQTSRGPRNEVTDVRLLQQGDLAEAWRGGRARIRDRRDALLDERHHARRPARGRDGNLAERVTTTELWTFLRASGGRWMLSAIQQAR